jgi:hypothetical protein
MSRDGKDSARLLACITTPQVAQSGHIKPLSHFPGVPMHPFMASKFKSAQVANPSVQQLSLSVTAAPFTTITEPPIAHTPAIFL